MPEGGGENRGEKPGRPVTGVDLVRWSEALSGIARTGLGFTDNLYERERFEEVLKVAADIRVAAGHELEVEVLVEEWLKVVGRGVPGYVTPKVAVGAVVGNEDEEILLIQRADSGVWLYPTGRRGLLRVGSGRQGGPRGDRHRCRAGEADCRPGRAAAGVQQRPPLLTRFPLPRRGGNASPPSTGDPCGRLVLGGVPAVAPGRRRPVGGGRLRRHPGSPPRRRVRLAARSAVARGTLKAVRALRQLVQQRVDN